MYVYGTLTLPTVSSTNRRTRANRKQCRPPSVLRPISPAYTHSLGLREGPRLSRQVRARICNPMEHRDHRMSTPKPKSKHATTAFQHASAQKLTCRPRTLSYNPSLRRPPRPRRKPPSTSTLQTAPSSSTLPRPQKPQPPVVAVCTVLLVRTGTTRRTEPTRTSGRVLRRSAWTL